MWLVRAIFWFLFFLNVCNKIDEVNTLSILSSTTSSLSSNGLIEILGTCFSNRLNTIIINPDVVNIIYFLTTRHSITSDIILLDESYDSDNVNRHYPLLPTYILSSDSIDKLQNTLFKLRSSALWSIESLFFIIGNNSRSNPMTCDDDASEVLQLLWKMDLLESFYVCPQPAHINNTKLLLYTYNPFTNWAPQPWQEVIDIKNKPDDRWTLYRQSHRNDKIICDTITFDKTKFLEGYGIKVIGFPVKNSNWTYNKNYSVVSLEYYFPHTYAVFFSTLFSALNVTPIINYDDNGIFVKNEVIGFLKSLVNGTQDMSMNNRYISETVNNSVDSIKLHHQNGFLITTQPRDFISAFDRISNFFDTKIIIFSVFVLLFTFIIIILNNKRQQYCVAALDILRLILSNAMKTQLKRPSMRITFTIASILIFFLTPSLQGQISSFLTKPERHNIENLNDLFDFKYHVYFHPLLRTDIINQKLWLNSDEKYLQPLSGYRIMNCYEHVLNDTNAACINYSLAQVKAASDHHFYISNKLLFKKYFSFWTRKNWALKNKVDQIAFKIRQSGLYDYWYKNELYDPLKKLITIESGDAFVKYSQIDISNLKFAFVFLAIGLGFSLIIFGFEIML